MKGRTYFRRKIGGGQKRRIGIDLSVDSFEIPRQPFEMLRLRGHFQFARPAEIAVDTFLGDQAFQRVD